MYYESKKEKQKDKLIVFVLLIVIIALLAILILKLDYKEEPTNFSSNYETTKLSTENVQNVDNNSKTINEVIKSVVGISKLEDNGNSIFLGNSEQKLGLGSGVILSDNGYNIANIVCCALSSSCFWSIFLILYCSRYIVSNCSYV